MYIKLSPNYVVRNDVNGSFLIRVKDLSSKEYPYFIQIPPFLGFIFHMIGMQPYHESLEKISQIMEISQDTIHHFIQQCVNSKSKKELLLTKNDKIVLPPSILESCDVKEERYFYMEENFNWRMEFKEARPTMPVSINLMTTTKCTTDCIYCYANRSLSPALSTKELKDIVEEVANGGALSLTLTDGDILAFPGWKEILSATHENGFHPFISTKTPVKENDLLFIKSCGYKTLSNSL